MNEEAALGERRVKGPQTRRHGAESLAVSDAIRLADVRLSFGRVTALDGLTLRVGSGQLYGFLGRNGAGKTTTLRILMGVFRAGGGQVEVLGQRVRRVPVELKRRIGYVSQEQHFYPWMTARQLGHFVRSFYPTWDEAEFARLLVALDVPPNRRSVELSGGTRTKLALALALAPRPALLLLDEPTSGLDPVARQEFNELLSSRVKELGTTALFSSHLVDEVEDIATHVGIIDAGRLKVEADVPSLLASMRRVRSPAPLVMPEGFGHVRGDVWRAAPEAWATCPWPEGVSAEALSLHEIFLAWARDGANHGEA
jgi:ABC-2 type transport system ATP-binding protein